MPLRYEAGSKFPDISLVDDRGEKKSVAEIADKRPLILAFYRGPW